MSKTKEKYKKLERNYSLDVARAFAILSVVLCHSVELAYANVDYYSLNTISQLFRIICLTIGRFGVPIFLFLTGALQLKKQIETDKDIFVFYKRNLLPLLLTVEIWIILYNLFLYIINGKFVILKLLRNVLFLEPVNMPHMWYMPLIIGFYVAIPFLAKIVKSFSLKVLAVPGIITIVGFMIIPSINIVLSIFKMKPIAFVIDSSFFGQYSGVYIMVGYYLVNERLLKKYSNIQLAITLIINLIITVGLQFFSYQSGVSYNVWYNSITLFIAALCLFELFTRINKKNALSRYFESISKMSLGIFFLHVVVQMILIRLLNIYNISNYLKTAILFVFSLAISIVIIHVFSKNKKLKKYLFLDKH